MTIHPDRVWATVERKMKAVVDCATSEERIVVAAHFPQSYDQVRKLLEGTGAKEIRSSMDILRWMQGDFPKIGLMLIPNILPLSVSPPQSEPPDVRLVVCERHPSRTDEERFQEWLWPFAGYVTYFESLDSPLMRVFGAERILSLMKSMGWNEDEAIEHSMVTSALEAAQKKIAARAVGTGPAHSAEEWFQMYFPNAKL